MPEKDIARAAARAAEVRLLCLDVDGTLTDGRLHFRSGVAGRTFHVLDGLGIQRFIASGGMCAIITAAAEDEGGDIRARAAQCGISSIHLGVRDKRAVVQQLRQAEAFDAAQVGYVGDDLPDLAAIQQAGFSAAPATAVPEIIAAVDYIAQRPAGMGAVRDVCEFIMAAAQPPRPAR